MCGSRLVAWPAIQVAGEPRVASGLANTFGSCHDFCEMRLLWLLAITYLVGCKSSVERPPPPTAPVSPVGPAIAASTELFAVPAEVAAKVTLRRVAHGLDRPVLLTAA